LWDILHPTGNIDLMLLVIESLNRSDPVKPVQRILFYNNENLFEIRISNHTELQKLYPDTEKIYMDLNGLRYAWAMFVELFIDKNYERIRKENLRVNAVRERLNSMFIIYIHRGTRSYLEFRC
jgi:hypothetical protein